MPSFTRFSRSVSPKGYYTVKKKYKRWDDQSAWVKQRLYLNLLKDPVLPADDKMDAEMGLYYELDLFESQPPADDGHL